MPLANTLSCSSPNWADRINEVVYWHVGSCGMKKCVVVFVYLHFNDGLKYMGFTPTCHFDGWQNHVVLSSFTPDCPKKMSRWTMPSSSAMAPIRNGGWRFIAMASRLLQKKTWTFVKCRIGMSQVGGALNYHRNHALTRSVAIGRFWSKYVGFKVVCCMLKSLVPT